jgi:hypothetical protein
MDAAPDAANMDVDGHPPSHSSRVAAVPFTQMALTPFNHSPMTARWREIVARARSDLPHLAASPPVSSRSSSPSRVRTFIQGRTRPGTSASSIPTPPTM